MPTSEVSEWRNSTHFELFTRGIRIRWDMYQVNLGLQGLSLNPNPKPYLVFRVSGLWVFYLRDEMNPKSAIIFPRLLALQKPSKDPKALKSRTPQ